MVIFFTEKKFVKNGKEKVQEKGRLGAVAHVDALPEHRRYLQSGDGRADAVHFSAAKVFQELESG